MTLKTDPNLSDPDAFYEALTNAHRALDREQSESLNARLILLLANHIGSLDILKEAIDIAKKLD